MCEAVFWAVLTLNRMTCPKFGCQNTVAIPDESLAREK